MKQTRPIIIRTKGQTIATSQVGSITMTTFGNVRYYVLNVDTFKIVRAGWYATGDEAGAELKPGLMERLLLEVGGRRSNQHGRIL